MVKPLEIESVWVHYAKLILGVLISKYFFYNVICNNKLKKVTTGKSVLGGDFNVVIDTDIDLMRNALSPYNNYGAEALRDLIVDKDLVDTHREQIGAQHEYT